MNRNQRLAQYSGSLRLYENNKIKQNMKLLEHDQMMIFKLLNFFFDFGLKGLKEDLLISAPRRHLGCLRRKPDLPDFLL